MKDCKHCKYAEWKRTAAGKLHPSGDGDCAYPWKMPQLPAAMFWVGIEPKPYRASISRRDLMKKDCPYFAWYKDRK